MNNVIGRLKKLEADLISTLQEPATSVQERRAKFLEVLRPVIESIEDFEERRKLRAELKSDFDEVSDKEAEDCCNFCYHAINLAHLRSGGEV